MINFIMAAAFVITAAPGTWNSFYYDFYAPPELVTETDIVQISVNGEMPICSHLPIPKKECTRIIASRSKSDPGLASEPVSGVWNNIYINADQFTEPSTYVFTAMNMRTGVKWEIVKIDQRGGTTPSIMPPNPPTLL